MAKDPAFLFYPEKFISGTMFMSDAQIGKYIKLLCHQHQNGGMIGKDDFENFVGDDNKIRAKFIETEDGFFNEMMMAQIEKRKKKSNNLSANASKRWEEHKQKQCKSNAIACDLHMPTINKNKTENINENKDQKEKKKKYGEYKHVLLTDKQYNGLIEDFGESLILSAIKILDEAIEEKGYKYRNHNLTLRKWPIEKAQTQSGLSWLELDPAYEKFNKRREQESSR